MAEAIQTCLNCEHVLPTDAKFCPECGQKVLTDADRKLRSLLIEAIEEMTDLRGRILPSFGALLFKPGLLALAYRIGRRKSFVPPFNLFLFANVLYFLLPGLSDFQITLVDQITLQPYSAWTESLVSSALNVNSAATAWRGGSEAFNQFAALYAVRSGDISKTLIFMHVPFVALVTLLLTVDRKIHYVDHVVNALHYMAFVMLFFILAPGLLLPLLRLTIQPFWPDLPLFRMGLALLWLYPVFMLRNAFELPWWRAIISAPLFMLGYAQVHTMYRLVQFLVIFYTL